MDLDRLQVVLRRRGVHEAMDLGLRIHQRWSGPVYRAWLATVVPAWVLILGITYAADLLWLGMLTIWWLKPLWDRIPLFVVSRAIFGATPTVREVWANLTRLWTYQALADLTWYRFSPGRSMLMPVGQLEGLSGRRAMARRQVLGRGAELGGATGLLLAGMTLEFLTAAGFIGLALMMLPDTPGFDFDTIFGAIDSGSGPFWARLSPVVGWLGALSAIEPVYVASGFALYLNRRTALEGWDVELSFRRLAARVAARARIAGALFLAAWMSASTVANATSPIPVDDIPVMDDGTVEVRPLVDLVYAEDLQIERFPGPDPTTTDTIDAAAESVFARPEFGYDKEVQSWQPKELPTFAGFDLTSLQEWFEWLANWSFADWLDGLFDGWFDGWETSEAPTDTERGWFGDGLSNMLEVVLWGIVAALIAGGVVLLWQRRAEFSKAPRLITRRPDTPTTAGGDIRGPKVVLAPEATIPERVWATWSSGDTDTALAMLYNAALAELATGRDLELDDAWTEGDCARAVKAQVGGPPAQYFQRVVRARTFVSYAHRPPDDHVVRSLCDDWANLQEAP